MAILNYLNKREFKFRKFCYLIVVGALCISLSILLNTYADQVKSSEHRIKAAFLYNFAKFVQWPAGSFGGPEDPIILCILGVNPFGEALKTIENKVVRGRPLLIRKIRETGKTGTEKIKDCHILFISISENENVTEILSAIRGRPIMTVSDMERFARRGGVIALFRIKNNIRFEINMEVAKQNNLKISSRLLKLARIFGNDD